MKAGEILSKQPEAMQLRYFGALQNIAGERSNTVVFPIPMHMLDAVKAMATGGNK